MEWLDARAVLEGKPALRVAEDLQRAAKERWRFMMTSVRELRPIVQVQRFAAAVVWFFGVRTLANSLLVSGPPKDGQPAMTEALNSRGKAW